MTEPEKPMAGGSTGAGAGSSAPAARKSITIWWFQWAPADGLAELVCSNSLRGAALANAVDRLGKAVAEMTKRREFLPYLQQMREGRR